MGIVETKGGLRVVNGYDSRSRRQGPEGSNHDAAAPPGPPAPRAPHRRARPARRRCCPPPPPAKATPESIEAEIAKSDHAELQGLLKRHFADDYQALIVVAVERRNEGISDQAFGQELFARFQDIMRSKLRFAAGAGIAMIDRLAAKNVHRIVLQVAETNAPAIRLYRQTHFRPAEKLPDYYAPGQSGLRMVREIGAGTIGCLEQSNGAAAYAVVAHS